MNDCTCAVPFTEDDTMCSACEGRWIESITQIDADQIPGDWDDYARRQG